MDIKKLGLASTIAVLSVTISLGGCDLFKSPEQLKTEKIANLRSTWKEKSRRASEASAKKDEAKRKRDELSVQLYEEQSARLKEAERKRDELSVQLYEQSARLKEAERKRDEQYGAILNNMSNIEFNARCNKVIEDNKKTIQIPL